MAEATIDQQFIEYIVKTLVGKPDQVRIERKIDERGVLLELYVDQEDLGRVIGRNGATAKSIRTLLRALGVKNDARYNLKIVDTNGGGQSHETRQEETTATDQPAYSQSDTSPSESPSPSAAPSPSPEPPTPSASSSVSPSSEPSSTTPTPQPETPEQPAESDVDRHRREIEDIAGGLDI